MSQGRTKPSVSTLLGRKHGISSRVDIEWERIMVQITFAFVIILGYLISVEMNEARQLAAESARYRQRNAALSQLVSTFRGSEAGEERAKRLVVERELQLQKLLYAWAQIRIRRELYKGLMQFRHAELVELSDDLESLPVGDDFAQFKEEVDRVFLAGDVADEVLALVRRALTEAGFDPRSVEEVELEDALPSEAAAPPRSRRLWLTRLLATQTSASSKRHSMDENGAVVE